METELCKIAYNYGADKCPKINHQYTPFYYEFLKHKRDFKKVVELGVGNDRIFKYIPHYQIGASLRMWRDFFPQAQIYGIDIEEKSMFTDNRIKTFLCDERNTEDLRNVILEIGTDIDLFIDDGSHHYEDQKKVFETVFPMLKRGAIYIVEDCGRNRRMTREYPEYESFVPELPKNERPKAHDKLVIFTR